MKRTYNTGLDTNEIKFACTVGTVGAAYSSVYCRRSGGQQTKLLESNKNSGNISESSVGKASTLKGSYLIVTTYIDFSAFKKSEWKKLADQIVIRYRLSGGFSGTQEYNHDLDDMQPIMDGKMVIVTKPIEMI